MSPEILIRPASDADALRMATLICNVLWTSNLDDYGADNVARVADHFTPAGVRAMLDNRLVTYVALAGPKLVGTAGFDMAGDGSTAVIKTFFVDPTHQRSGIGSLLFDAVMARAQAHGAQVMTVRSSIAGEPFYARHGFVRLRDHWDGDERTIEMQKTGLFA